MQRYLCRTGQKQYSKEMPGQARANEQAHDCAKEWQPGHGEERETWIRSKTLENFRSMYLCLLHSLYKECTSKRTAQYGSYIEVDTRGGLSNKIWALQWGKRRKAVERRNR